MTIFLFSGCAYKLEKNIRKLSLNIHKLSPIDRAYFNLTNDVVTICNKYKDICED